MFKPLPAIWLVSIFSLSAAAQTPAQVSSTPGVVQESPPAYRSAFEGYKPYTDDKLLDWKDANDNTGRIGGWRVYAKEASQPEVKPPVAEATTRNSPQPEGAKP